MALRVSAHRPVGRVLPCRPAVAPAGSRHGALNAGSLLMLQRLAGNGAVVGHLGKGSHAHLPVSVQRSRCGGACHCGGQCGRRSDEEIDEPAQAQRLIPVQRQESVTDPCDELIADDEWKLKGAKPKRGYDTRNYYRDVAKAIIETGDKRGVGFEQALFIVAQARGEQGVKDPGAHRFRVLNIQVSDAERRGATRDPANKDIWVTREGRKYVWMCSPEDGKACEGKPEIAEGCEAAAKKHTMTETMCMRKSPFYVYDSMEDQVNHYLDHVAAQKPNASNILHKGKGTEKAEINEFGAALAGYGSDLKYRKKLCNNYNQVVKDMGQILDRSIERKTKCVIDGWEKIGKAWENLNRAKENHQRASA